MCSYEVAMADISSENECGDDFCNFLFGDEPAYEEEEIDKTRITQWGLKNSTY